MNLDIYKRKKRVNKLEQKLIAGKRYQWLSVANVPASHMNNGLFTGHYDDKGLAILVTRNNDEWHVHEKNCTPIPKRGKKSK